MGQFHLRIRQDSAGSTEVVPLDDDDASSALSTLFWRKCDRQAELWNAERLICKLERVGSRDGLWYVAPGQSTVEA
ncbi:MAG TPA: hypothetical protein VF418_10520 [Sphingomonadaceae bacterium]